jgi:DnaK suppressor protein
MVLLNKDEVMANHFDKKFLDSQRKKLLNLKTDIMNSIQNKIHDEIAVPSDELIEDGDQANTYISQNVTFGLRERELQRLREVEYALSKIDSGSYGICEEYDEPIEKVRLEKMPWARLCIQAAEEQERERKIKAS